MLALALGLACCADDADGPDPLPTAGTATAGSGPTAGTAPTAGAGSGAAGGETGDAGAAAGQGTCPVSDGSEPAPEVSPSGLSGPIGELSAAQKEAFCDWLWGLPGYGEEYCCKGVVLPLRISVQDDEDRASCVEGLSRLDACTEVMIEAYEACAIDKLGRHCGTPPGCFLFGHGALTSTCYSP